MEQLLTVTVQVLALQNRWAKGGDSSSKTSVCCIACMFPYREKLSNFKTSRQSWTSIKTIQEKEKMAHYCNNNVHFKGVRFSCGPHLAINGPGEARADLMAR